MSTHTELEAEVRAEWGKTTTQIKLQKAQQDLECLRNEKRQLKQSLEDTEASIEWTLEEIEDLKHQIEEEE